MKNREVAHLLRQIADLLEIKGENVFRIRAYRRAADSIESLAEDIAALTAEGRLTEIPGVGKDLAAKVQEYLQTGQSADLEKLSREIPPSVAELVRIPGVGPKTAKLLFDLLHVDSVSVLEEAAKGGRLLGLPGIKEKTVENILKGIEVVKRGRERMPLGKARALAQEVAAALTSLPEVDEISVAGSLRRMRETVKDIDILVTSTAPRPVMDLFTRLPGVEEVLAKGETKASVRHREGIQIDLRVVEPSCSGAALQYFTGSAAHNIRVRELAVRRGLTVSEYGVFRESTGQRIAGATEEEVYRAVGLPYIPPEMREDTGEIEAAREGTLPRLIEIADIRGDLHAHTEWSDGHHSLEALVEAAIARGYEYIIISDHSQSSTVAGGLTPEELLDQVQKIRALNARYPRFRILAGSECDIRADGTMDFPDEVLAQLDIVVAAVHSRFKQSREEMTARIVKALTHPCVHILAHPTGRLLGERDPYDVDMEAVLTAAAAHGKAVEINSQPPRLDLNDRHARLARERGVPLAIDTDTHTLDQLDNIALGIGVARRAWLTKEDVINTRPCADLLAWAHKGRTN